MALSPEDVIKKSFTSTHLRRGYDETQVDDFLDEVVVELRRLNAERVTLENDLKDCRSGQGFDAPVAPAYVAGSDASESLRSESDELARIRRERGELVAELDRLQQRIENSRANAEAAEQDATQRVTAAQIEIERAEASLGESHEKSRERLDGDLKKLQQRVDDARREADQARARAQAAQQEADRAIADADKRATRAARDADAAEHRSLAAASVATPIAPPKPPTTENGDDATAIISLAQKLHDQHVSEGENAKARLVSEADAYAERVQAEADERSRELIETGQRKHDQLVNSGQRQHDELVAAGQRKHDQLVATGQKKYDAKVGEAQSTHDRLLSEAQTTHDALIREGRENRDHMVGEAEQRRNNVLGDLKEQQSSLTASIADLTGRQREARSKLRAMLSQQLDTLEGEEP